MNLRKYLFDGSYAETAILLVCFGIVAIPMAPILLPIWLLQKSLYRSVGDVFTAKGISPSTTTKVEIVRPASTSRWEDHKPETRVQLDPSQTSELWDILKNKTRHGGGSFLPSYYIDFFTKNTEPAVSIRIEGDDGAASTFGSNIHKEFCSPALWAFVTELMRQHCVIPASKDM